MYRAFVRGIMVKICLWVLMLLFLPNIAMSYDVDLKEYLPLDGECSKLFAEREINGQEDVTNYFTVTYSQEGTQDGVVYYRRSELMGLDEFPRNRDYDFIEAGWGEEAVLVRELYNRAEEEGEEAEHLQFDPPVKWYPRYLELGKSVKTDTVDMVLLARDLEVKVPGGNFSRCIEVRYTVQGEPGCENYLWLAHGVGIVKMKELCEDEEDQSELVAMRTGEKVSGSPYCQGNAASFALATARGVGCSVVIDGIAVKGYDRPFWAKFDLDLQDLSLVLNSSSVGTGLAPEQTGGVCNVVPGMDFGVEAARIWDCTQGYNVSYAGLFVVMEYEGQRYYLEFYFDPLTLSFRLRGVWDGQWHMIWHGI